MAVLDPRTQPDVTQPTPNSPDIPIQNNSQASGNIEDAAKGQVPPFLSAHVELSDQANGVHSEDKQSATPSPTGEVTSDTKASELPDSATSQSSDEEEALRSLDVTLHRPLPDVTELWSDDLRRSTSRAADHAPKLNIPTGVLVAVVAAVSFVAGGMTARLSAQMPLLFAQKPDTLQSPATYEEPAPVAEPSTDLPAQEAPTEEPPATTTYDSWRTAPTYDTGDDVSMPDDDTGEQGDGDRDVSDTDKSHDQDVTWYFGPDDRTISYDRDRNRVTLDYDNYEMTLDLDGLLGTDDVPSTPRTPYDDNTGYDVDLEERDSRGWRGYHT